MVSAVPASQVVTLAVPGFGLPTSGAATAFVLPPRGHVDASDGADPSTPPSSGFILVLEPPVTESSLVPFRPRSGPLDWPARGDAGEA